MSDWCYCDTDTKMASFHHFAGSVLGCVVFSSDHIFCTTFLILCAAANSSFQAKNLQNIL